MRTPNGKVPTIKNLSSDPTRTRIIVMLVIIALYGIAAIFGPILMNFDPTATDLTNRLLAPGAERTDGTIAVLGTDQIGRDLLSLVLYGGRVSMIAGVFTLLLAGLIGVALGLFAGFRGGWTDAIIMRLADLQLAFPAILLAILLVAVLGPSLLNVILVLAVANWVVFARVTRAQALSIRSREYVSAAHTLGGKQLYLMFRTVLPNALAPLLVVATVQVGMVIIAEASLSFLGLGTPLSTPSWGLVISDGRAYLDTAWWIATIPGLALSGLVLTLGLLGDALRDRFDPRMKTL